jgi:UDP-3-O-[3-hydroxymyristoyl] glucosamine N-acyltransferase
MLRATLHENEIRRAIGVTGGGLRVVDGIAPISVAADRCLYFINRNIPDVHRALATRQGCILIAATGSSLATKLGDCVLLEVANPRLAIARVLQFIRAEGRQPSWLTARNIAPDAVISPMSLVEDNVEIGAGVTIEPFCTVGPDVKIGAGSIIRSGARIYPRVVIGANSVIGANAVIGSEGYGFVRDEEGNKLRIPHLGGVLIGSQVEIGALSVVQYGTISPTVIEDYAKIDDNVEIAHNVRVERNVSITGGVVIGGSATIESETWIGMNSTVRNGRTIGAHTLIGMDVSVQRDLPENVVARARPPIVTARTDDDLNTIGFNEPPLQGSANITPSTDPSRNSRKTEI